MQLCLWTALLQHVGLFDFKQKSFDFCPACSQLTVVIACKILLFNFYGERAYCDVTSFIVELKKSLSDIVFIL